MRWDLDNMKKFVFSLAFLLKMKILEEKRLKIELSEIEIKLQKLIVKIRENKEGFQRYRNEYNVLLNKGVDANAVEVYKNYFYHYRTLSLELEEKLLEINAEKELLQQKIREVLAEKKALENLKAKQYQEYLVEQQKELEKEINDFISFNSNTKGLEE